MADIRVLGREADVFPWQHSLAHDVVVYCTCVCESVSVCPLATGFKGVAAKKACQVCQHPVVSSVDL